MNFAQVGRSRIFTKSTYFIALSEARNVNSFEIYSPSLEYTETWLCSSKFLTPQIQDTITAVPGVFRFRVYSQDPPLHTELGATDRCCITFGIAESEAHKVADFLESIYACLSQEVTTLAQQDLQRVTPLFWNMRFGDAPTFYNYNAVTFFDIRSRTQEERWRLQAILIDMGIPYYIQKRLLLVIYAEGIELENFRLRTFQEQIKIPFVRKKAACNVPLLSELVTTIGQLTLTLQEAIAMRPFKLKMMDRLLRVMALLILASAKSYKMS